MYKVFFNDRTVIFGDDFPKAFRNNSGLFYKFQNRRELSELIDLYRGLHTIKKLYIFHHDPEILRKAFISLFKLINAGGGLVYNKHNEFLVIKRNGIWDLPKGKSEKGETSENTALREVSEECGIDYLELKKTLIKTYHTYSLKGSEILKETQWFEMYTDSEKVSPQLIENITEVKWLKKSDASSILNNTFPSVADVLKSAGLLSDITS